MKLMLFLLIIFFLPSCFTVAYKPPSSSEVVSSIKRWEKDRYRNYQEFKLRKCEEECEGKINNIFYKVNKYYGLNVDLYLLSMKKYWAISTLQKIIISDFFLSAKDEDIASVLCHEASHISYGHIHEKHFLKLVRKFNETPISFGVTVQKNLGAGKVMQNKAKNIDNWLVAAFVNSLGAKIGENNIYNNNNEEEINNPLINIEDTTYLGAKIYPLNFEMQADIDSLRCLKILGFPEKSQLLFINKVFRLENKNPNLVDIFKKRVDKMKRKIYGY